MDATINPFKYGGAIGPEAFCNRTQELHDLARAATNAERLFVYSERRVGKTSLVQRVLDTLPKKDYLPIYIDLYPTDGTGAFVRTVAKTLTEAAASRADKLAETAKGLFRHLTPTLTFDESGHPILKLGARSGTEREPELEDVLEAPARVAEREKRRLVVVFDEFQRILEYKSDLVERMLRSRVQMHQEIAYFFLGSRKHLMRTMFLDASRPLYRAAGHYPLGMIATEHWKPFVRERFEAAEKDIADEHVEALCGLTEGHPFYTQHLAHALWEITPAGEAVSQEKLHEAVDVLLRREETAYATLWETFSRSQQRFLRGLAEEGSDAQPFSAGFVRAHGLGATSSAQRAAEALLERDVLDREGGSLLITDRFFRLWIQRL